jgi:hypothetical protein
MTYLIKTTEQYRCNSEEEAKEFIEEQKRSNQYEVVRYSSEVKQTKVKGEIADEWMRVTIVKEFNSEKEPVVSINRVSYGDDE